jgi:hypothetical protein
MGVLKIVIKHLGTTHGALRGSIWLKSFGVSSKQHEFDFGALMWQVVIIAKQEINARHSQWWLMSPSRGAKRFDSAIIHCVVIHVQCTSRYLIYLCLH